MAEWVFFMHPPRDDFIATMTDGERSAFEAHAAWALPGLGEHLPQRAPELQRAVPDREHRGAHSAAGAVAQQVGPGFGGLPVAVGEGDELFAADKCGS